MSQQVPFDNSGFPQGSDMVAPGGYADAAHESYSQSVSAGAGQSVGTGQYGSGGYWQPPQGPPVYERSRVPMIDPIESAKLTPQILVLLVLSGIRRHWKWSIPAGLILGLLTAATLYLVFPLQYESRANLQIRSTIPTLLSAGVQQSGYDNFVNTQLAMMKSPTVIDGVLRNPDVGKLPVVLKQKDKRSWLTKNLVVRSISKSEFVTVSLATEAKDASEVIVNTVVDIYFKTIKDNARQTDRELNIGLTAERQIQITTAQHLQEQIRHLQMEASKMGAVTDSGGMGIGTAQGDSLERDVAIAESQLFALEAKQKAIMDRYQNPERVPIEILLGSHPRYIDLSQQKMEQQQHRDELLKAFQANDPRVAMVVREIDAIDQEIKKLTSGSDGSGIPAMYEALRFQETLNLYQADEEVRAQKILVDELRKKRTEQLEKAGQRTLNIVDASYLITQLARANKTIDQMDDRMLAIKAESRAPAQISPLTRAVSSEPNRLRQVMIVGVGSAMLMCCPLFLSIVIERLKPRLYHVSQVRRAIPQVLIGEIMEPPVSWVHGATFRRRLARYRESVHNWCTHLLLSDPFRRCRTLSIASVAGDDGKTFLAVQIAVAMAQMREGKVLLIDGDMRVGRLHMLFGNEEAGIGLADVLSFRNKQGEAITQNEREPNLHLITAGQLDVSPYELLGDGRFRELLDSLEQNDMYNPNGYSLIIVVLPPIANAAESLIMAQSTDSTLLCVRQGETVIAAMEDVYRKLINTGSSVDGIVVKDIPYYQMSGRNGGFADKLEQIRLSHLLQYAD